MNKGERITGLLRLPQDPAFGRMVPKSKIYAHTRSSAKLKAVFVQQVEKIVHTSILSPKTVNIPAKEPVLEIHVLSLLLRTPTLKPDILQAIDRAIPYPTLFVLSYQNKIQYCMAYKRPSEADRRKWVISSHFATDWIANNSDSQNLPLALSLQTLYERLIKAILPIQSRGDETIDQWIARAENIGAMQCQVVELKKKIDNKNLQYNRRVELNAQLKELNKQINAIKD